MHLDLDYPDVPRDLNRWLPLVKWLLAIPHFIVLVFLGLGAFVSVVIAWFAILFTGRYPRGLFDYVVGVGRWGTARHGLRVPARHRPLPAVLAAALRRARGSRPGRRRRRAGPGYVAGARRIRPEPSPRVASGSGTTGRRSAQEIMSAAEDEHRRGRSRG